MHGGMTENRTDTVEQVCRFILLWMRLWVTLLLPMSSISILLPLRRRCLRRPRPTLPFPPLFRYFLQHALSPGQRHGPSSLSPITLLHSATDRVERPGTQTWRGAWTGVLKFFLCRGKVAFSAGSQRPWHRIDDWGSISRTIGISENYSQHPFFAEEDAAAPFSSGFMTVCLRIVSGYSPDKSRTLDM